MANKSRNPGAQVVATPLDGVEIRELTNISTPNGITTELFRPEWGLGMEQVAHMIHVFYRPFAVSAWHKHEHQTDYIVVTDGMIRLVVFDDRSDSPTYKQLSVFHLNRFAPRVVKLPPGIWHGLKNMSGNTSSFVNYFDIPYNYENPDYERLPVVNDKIPYTFD